MKHAEKEVKSNVALNFNCRTLSLQLYCAQISVTGLFSHLKPCKKETNCKDHTDWKFNQNQIGKDKPRSRSEPQALKIHIALWQGCVSFSQPRF